jgi:hypothetical protein
MQPKAAPLRRRGSRYLVPARWAGYKKMRQFPLGAEETKQVTQVPESSAVSPQVLEQRFVPTPRLIRFPEFLSPHHFRDRGAVPRRRKGFCSIFAPTSMAVLRRLGDTNRAISLAIDMHTRKNKNGESSKQMTPFPSHIIDLVVLSDASLAGSDPSSRGNPSHRLNPRTGLSNP